MGAKVAPAAAASRRRRQVVVAWLLRRAVARRVVHDDVRRGGVRERDRQRGVRRGRASSVRSTSAIEMSAGVPLGVPLVPRRRRTASPVRPQPPSSLVPPRPPVLLTTPPYPLRMWPCLPRCIHPMGSAHSAGGRAGSGASPRLGFSTRVSRYAVRAERASDRPCESCLDGPGVIRGSFTMSRPTSTQGWGLG